MAESTGGPSAGPHQAATFEVGWQQVANPNAAAGLAAAANRAALAQNVGPVAVMAARAPYQAGAVQRHQLGAAGRAALHIARQVRPEQHRLGGAMDWQFAQLGATDAGLAPHGALSLQQRQHLQHQQQQLQLLQQQPQQQENLQQQFLQQQQQRGPAGYGMYVAATHPRLLSGQQLQHQQQQLLAARSAVAIPAASHPQHVHNTSESLSPGLAAVSQVTTAIADAAGSIPACGGSSSSGASGSGSQAAAVSATARRFLPQPQPLSIAAAVETELQQQHLRREQQLQLLQQLQIQQQQQQLQLRQQQQLPQGQLAAQLRLGGLVIPAPQPHHNHHQQQPHHYQQALSPQLSASHPGAGPSTSAPTYHQHLASQHLQGQSRPRAVRPLSAAALAAVAVGNAAGGGADTVALSVSANSSGSSVRTPVSVGRALGRPGSNSLAAVFGGGAGGGDSSATDRCDDLDPYDGASSEAGSAADSDEFVSPNHPICEEASSWASLTAGLLARVMGVLASAGALPSQAPALRCVCRHWRSVVDAHLECLSPVVMKVRAITTRFASLRALHLDHCSSIRNRDLLVLSRAPSVQQLLHTLTLGDDRTRPWVSNRGLASVCRITSLTRLTLCDCLSITNRGLAPLSSLTGLTCLSLRGCRKLTNQGLESLRGLRRLQILSLYGVVRLSDKGLVPLSALPALRSLELGNTRIRDEGLGHAAKLTGLRSLSLVHEDVTDTGVRQLSALSGLTRLVLRETVEVSGETLAVLLPALKELQVLDVQRNWAFNNMQLARCLPALIASSALTALNIRATWVCDEGVAAIGRIPSLRRLAISPQHEHWSKYLPVLPQLTQLTALSLRNLPTLPYELMEVLTTLPDLRELDVSEEPLLVEGAAAATSGWVVAAAAAAAAVAAKEPLWPYTVAAIARLRALRHLDVSRRNVLPDQALFLAMCMPSLERLVAVQCPLPPAAVARLWQQRPQLVVVAGPTSQHHYHLHLLAQLQTQQASSAWKGSQGGAGPAGSSGGKGGSGGGGVGELMHGLLLDEMDGFSSAV